MVTISATMVFAFMIALLLNQRFKGRGWRAHLLPAVILSSGVLVGIETNNR